MRRRERKGDAVRHAVSVAVFREGRSRLLTVRRPPDDEELPGVWGLPAASIRDGESDRAAVLRTGRDKLGVDLRPLGLLEEGDTERDTYRLRMRLYEAELPAGRPSVPQDVTGVTQYTACEWAAPDRLREAARRGSLCSRLCLGWLGEEW